MKKLLVIDDDTVFTSILSKSSHTEELECDSVHSVHEFKQADLENYDGFVVDYDLGDGTGLEILEYFEKKGVKAPVVLISSSSQPPPDPLHPNDFPFLSKWDEPKHLLKELAKFVA